MQKKSHTVTIKPDRSRLDMLLFLGGIILAIVFRTALISSLPPGMNEDELDFTLNAKALYLLGHGVSVSASPITLNTNFPRAELQSVLTGPLIAPWPFSLTLARLPYAAIGVISCILISLIASLMIGRKYRLPALYLAALNPWSIFFNRTAYDAPVTTFFILLTWYLSLKLTGWKILLLLVPLLLAFHAYTGMMIVVLLFSLCTIFYLGQENKFKYRKYYLLIILGLLLCSIRFAFFIEHQADDKRGGVINKPSLPIYQTITNYERRLSLNFPLEIVFSNKYVAYLRDLRYRYINAFSHDLLFYSGDSKYIFTTNRYGLFHPIDALLFAVGWYLLFRNKKRLFMFLMALTVISPIPSALNSQDVSYASRSYLLEPVLILVGTYGLNYIREHSHRLLLTGLFIVYTIQVTFFTWTYFVFNPVNNSESFNLSTRILARYLRLAKTVNPKITFLGSLPENQMKYYAFYNNLADRSQMSVLSQQLKQRHYPLHLDGITFDTCPSDSPQLRKSLLIIENGWDRKCDWLKSLPSNSFSIVRFSDGLSLYNIYNDQICRVKTQNDWLVKYEDLKVESLTTERFCNLYFKTF